MVAKFVIVLCLAVASHAGLIPIAKVAYAEPEAPANYEFNYSVHDGQSGDVKQQQEARAGDAVHGSYSLVQPDGVHRIVEYTADKINGFNANVRYEGTPIQQQPAKIVYSAPAAKIAYSAPVAKIAYSAPVAKIAYSAPVAKIAYAAPVSKIAYAPAPLSYANAPISYSQGPVSYAAAPITKVSYGAPIAHVSYSSPAISYQH